MSLILFAFLELFFFLQPEIWDYNYPFLPLTSTTAPGVRRTDEKNFLKRSIQCWFSNTSNLGILFWLDSGFCYILPMSHSSKFWLPAMICLLLLNFKSLQVGFFCCILFRVFNTIHERERLYFAYSILAVSLVLFAIFSKTKKYLLNK